MMTLQNPSTINDTDNCTCKTVTHTRDFPAQNHIKDTMEGVGVGMET